MKVYVQSILLLLLTSAVVQATMVINFGAPVQKVNSNVGATFTLGNTIGLDYEVSFGNGSSYGTDFRAEVVIVNVNGAPICTAVSHQRVVSSNSSYYYDPSSISGATSLAGAHTAYTWGSYFDIYDGWHLMNSDSYEFTQGMN